MLNYLNNVSLGAMAPTYMATESYTIAAGAGLQLVAPIAFPPPNELPTYLSLVISNTEAAASGNDIILSYDNSPNNNFGIVIFPQSTFTLDLRAFNYFDSSVMAINGQPWPLGGDSTPFIQNNNAGPVRAMGAWMGVL